MAIIGSSGGYGWFQEAISDSVASKGIILRALRQGTQNWMGFWGPSGLCSLTGTGSQGLRALDDATRAPTYDLARFAHFGRR